MANLLIVEDDALMQETLTEQLGRAGHTITTAKSGAAAQQLMERQRFDALVLFDDVGDEFVATASHVHGSCG